jgi:hypothetical protein
MATAASWLKQQSEQQAKAAQDFFAKLEAMPDAEVQIAIASFVVAMTTAHVMNALSVAIETIAADAHLTASGARRQNISEEAAHARRAAARGFATDDWSEFDAIISGQVDSESESRSSA